ncbi:uncharacterized protein BDZ83DRAFT_327737 [Colletotrichum acutatum]|uniref:Zn(2)-C6 fungal-type domain-containing protein n=1 Tax=Glomerella acutata TaxID=27357 RepID=A0AAD8UP02_GLOAC|nr:uncharacterized protein BDZ83DRAFT_327737 [Colletotrichum acutatum]KAK1724781.1 hypothetical protein BDZ83DRAFT_327737 [Colletotrichum acutatum]
MTERIRRAHHKSRLGCRRCKTRRIKCDEVQPACGGCTKANLRPPVLVDTMTDGLKARFFRHYLDMTAAYPSTDQQSWSSWITDLAVTDSTLMDAVIGFAAFHLRRSSASDDSSGNGSNTYAVAVSEASHAYMARAIEAHSRLIVREGINAQNAPVVMATCTIIMFHTSANQSFLDSSGGGPGAETGYRVPHHWFTPFRNVNALLKVALPGIRNSRIGHLYKPERQTSSQQNETLGPARPGTFDFLLEDLNEDETDPETAKAYRIAVDSLDKIQGSALQRDLLRFPAHVPPRLVELLEAEDPRTLAIVGYFFMLLRRATHLWWAQGAAEKEFDGVMGVLPREWWPKMAWAIEEFKWTEG